MNRNKVFEALITLILISGCGLIGAGLIKFVTGNQDIAMFFGVLASGVGIICGLLTLFAKRGR